MRLPSLARRLLAPSCFAGLFSALSGYHLSAEDLLKTGKRAVLLKYRLDMAMGSTIRPAALPERFLIDPESNHKLPAVVPYKRLQERYRKLRIKDMALAQEDR